MAATLKVINAILFIFFTMVCIDLMLSYYHEKSYGPYKLESAEIINSNLWCQKRLNNIEGFYELELLVKDTLYKTQSPFIGLYPMRLCVFGKYVPLYDYYKLANLKSGDKIQVLISNENKVFLGKTPYMFNLVSMVLLLLGFIALTRLKKSFKSMP